MQSNKHRHCTFRSVERKKEAFLAVAQYLIKSTEACEERQVLLDARVEIGATDASLVTIKIT